MSSRPVGRPPKDKVEIPPPNPAEGVEGMPFEVDGIYADVKVTKIIPENPRPICAVYAKRNGTGAVIKVPVTDSKGNVKEYAPAFETDEFSMTAEDFQEFVKSRAEIYQLGD